MKALFLVLAAMFIMACTNNSSSNSKKSASTAEAEPAWALEEVWRSDTLMRTCESVMFDPANKQLYVACINGAPWEKDGMGFIGLLNLDGSLKSEKWVSGLDAPKGMGMHDNKLYVADMDQIICIDIAKGEILKKIPVEGAQQLNDIAVDEDGSIYFTDSNTGWIWILRDGKPEPWIEGDFERPNGLFVEDSRVLLATSRSSELVVIDKESKEFKTVTTEIGHGDGIEFTGKEGHYLVSSWSGEIFLVLPDYSKISLLKTADDGMNSADLAFNTEEQIAYVPTFFDNRVVAYKLNR